MNAFPLARPGPVRAVPRLAAGAALFLAVFGGPARAAEDEPGGFRILPGAHADVSLQYYLGQSTELQKKRFVTAADVCLEFGLLAWNETSLIGKAFLHTGMGPSVTDALPFSPVEMHYELAPFLERQGTDFLWRAGWVHACDHLIYKAREYPWYTREAPGIEPDVYWNRLFAGFGASCVRPTVQRGVFFDPDPSRRPALGLIWYAEAGYYLRSLGDWIDSQSLSGHNPWAWDLAGELRAPLWTGSSAALFGNSRTALLVDEEGKGYWRETLQLEILWAGGTYGSSVFFGAHVLDEHPRDTRENLMEIGARFFY